MDSWGDSWYYIYLFALFFFCIAIRCCCFLNLCCTNYDTGRVLSTNQSSLLHQQQQQQQQQQQLLELVLQLQQQQHHNSDANFEGNGNIFSEYNETWRPPVFGSSEPALKWSGKDDPHPPSYFEAVQVDSRNNERV